jgi:hypothetical protein
MEWPPEVMNREEWSSSRQIDTIGSRFAANLFSFGSGEPKLFHEIDSAKAGRFSLFKPSN